MRFDLITIFPEMFGSYLNESILKRAQEKRLVRFNVHDLRRWANDKHQKVDDSPYGGGPGMVMKVEPIFRALRALKISSKIQAPRTKTRVILTSAKGKQFTASDARRLAKYKRIVVLCGRYEGVDERVAKHLADEEVSIGPYVLTGGELAAMVIADAVTRHLPGVLGRSDSIEESRGGAGIPQYTRPPIFNRWKIPDVLLSGNHKKIAAWRVGQLTPPAPSGRRKRRA